jgi:hypothetical protein
MPPVPFAEYTPDQPQFGTGNIEALNAIPAARSYKPFPSFGAISTTPLAHRCQGAGAFRSDSGAIGVFAGDSTKLYLLSGTAWTDASKAGGYSTDPAGRWCKVAFGDLALFTNGVDPIQKITIDGGTAFANLGGSPPVCRYLAVCKDYVIAARLGTDATAVQWCETNNPEGWSIGSGGGDIQPMPDNGEVTGIIGGDFFIVLLERGVHRFDFVGGDIVFQRRQIGFGVGCTIPGSVAAFNDRAFFYHETGFHMCVSGSVPVPIGNERVNNYFRSRISAGARDYVFADIDPGNSLYVIGFNTDGSANYPITEWLIFKWNAGEAGRWAHVIDGNSYDCLFSGLSAVNTTLEDLDVYGTLEAVPLPLDSPAWIGEGHQLLGGFGSDHNSGWFNGAPMTATLTTADVNVIEGQSALVRGLRPLVESTDSPTISVTVKARRVLTETPASNDNSQSKTPNARGLVRTRIKGRYHRAEVVISGNWVDAIGIDDIEAYPLGAR